MIFTFGFGHSCSCGLSLRACYVELATRGEMAEHYGQRWAFEYADAEAAGVERWALQRVEPGPECECGGLGRPPFEPALAEPLAVLLGSW